ncbi:hypothetical protein JCM5296_000502 [Sporobolomyces johnsonii]
MTESRTPLEPAALHTLPPELVAHILSLSAAPSSSSAADDPLFPRRRRRTLESLSLVCSQWRPIAQRLLLQDGAVSLYHHTALTRLSAVVLGVHEQQLTKCIRSLHLTLWGESQPDDLVQLVTLCEGLEQLVLEHVDRVRLDQVATGARLESFSARQCTFVAPFSPASSPSPYPAPTIYPSLRSLDLRLCSFRRDSLPIHSASLPALRHLLLFTGAHDQSRSTVERFLRAAAPRVWSLSLDQTAWDLLLPPEEPGGGGEEEEAVSSRQPRPSLATLVPHLRTYGLYWDAAHRTLVGAPLLASRSSTNAPPPPPPPYLHLSLYPSALDSLLGAFSALFPSQPQPPDSASASASASASSAAAAAAAAHASPWRFVEHLQFEQTFRHLSLLDEGDPLEDLVVAADPASSAADEDAATRLLARFTKPCTNAGVSWSVDGTPRRGTKEIGFDTSWWRFVRPSSSSSSSSVKSTTRARSAGTTRL